MILSWYENHTSEDVPPEYLWEDAEGLEEWWDRVKERHEIRASGGGGRAPGSDDNSGDEFEGNELARALKE